MQSTRAQIRNGLRLVKEWGVTSRTLSVIDSELIRAFIVLDKKSIVMVDAEPVDIQQVRLETTSPAMRVSGISANIDEARTHFEFVLSQTLY